LKYASISDLPLTLDKKEYRWNKTDDYISYIFSTDDTDNITCNNWRKYYNGSLILWEINWNWSISANTTIPHYLKMVRCVKTNEGLFESYKRIITVKAKTLNNYREWPGLNQNQLDKIGFQGNVIWGIGEGMSGIKELEKIDELWNNLAKQKYQTMNTTWWILPPRITSSDKYVDEKFNEINHSFKDTYDSHLDNLDKIIIIFNKTIENSSDEKIKYKYQKAINKLEEIRKLYINRYKFIKNYEA
jgi:hypothetical protein